MLVLNLRLNPLLPRSARPHYSASLPALANVNDRDDPSSITLKLPLPRREE